MSLTKRMNTAALGAALALSGALAGCASGPTMTYLPSGETGFAINCSGADASTSWAACYKQAGETCGAYGYDVVSKDADNGATAGGSVGGIFGANIKTRSMVIRCKQ
ncbi:MULTISPECIES: hypothetical protein [Caballeronia]|uniref:Lipoprotein n=1 Tax=Caballeronia cordobensis TaxID=1353886 RepID=A0A158IJW2_CABCO|nr:lipoprotein [Burkholderia sp. YI23]BAO86963.1 lipoprotein [Burkholderia sp. RPE67]SAL56815.1 hypothetical protein AWB70_04964 [Caballeronia cordobensis]